MLHIFENPEQLSSKAASIFIESAAAAIREKGRFTVALTGGSSPVQLYRLLAQSPFKEQIPWQQTFIFWGDERWVPLDDDRSNAKMAFDTLLNQVPVPREQIFPMWAPDVAPEDFTLQYEQTLKTNLGTSAPAFDLILLGMGDDGHTASLFPGTAVLHEQDRMVVAYYLEPQEMYRITLTAPVINQAGTIMFLTFGAGKAKALQQVLAGEANFTQYPAQLIRRDETSVHWLVDKAAAAHLTASDK